MATTQHCQPLSTQSFEIDIPHHNIGFEVQSIPMNDREEIRRRLAMDSDSEDCISSRNISSTKRPFINKMMMSTTNDLRLCFLNETPDSIEATRGLQKFRQEAFNRIKNDFISNTGNSNEQENQSINDEVDQLTNQLNSLQSNQEKPRDLMVNLRRNKMERFRFILNTARPNDMSSFHRYHNLIIAEARFALSQAKEMARVQMETERLKQSTKPSPIASLLQVPTNDKFTRSVLRNMSIAKLQILVNDLHSRIEDLNEELVQILQERDELHMEQDSILVDIEDATIFLLRRLKHQNSKDSSRKCSQ